MIKIKKFLREYLVNKNTRNFVNTIMQLPLIILFIVNKDIKALLFTELIFLVYNLILNFISKKIIQKQFSKQQKLYNNLKKIQDEYISNNGINAGAPVEDTNNNKED